MGFGALLTCALTFGSVTHPQREEARSGREGRESDLRLTTPTGVGGSICTTPLSLLGPLHISTV